MTYENPDCEGEECPDWDKCHGNRIKKQIPTPSQLLYSMIAMLSNKPSPSIPKLSNLDMLDPSKNLNLLN